MKEIVRYAVVDDGGAEILGATYDSKRDAITSLEYSKGCTIVKLVGTMPEPKKMKKVALFVYQDRVYTYRTCSMLMTEEQAKKWCKDAGFNVIKYPYGEIIEVEE